MRHILNSKFTYIIFLTSLLLVTPNSHASKWKKLSDIVRVASVGKNIIGLVYPSVTKYIDIETKDSWIPGMGMVLRIKNKSSDTLKNIQIIYNSRGKIKKFTISKLKPGEIEKIGWLEGAPSIGDGDSIEIDAHGCMSEIYHF